MTRKSSISYRTEPGIFTGNLLGERAAAELRRNQPFKRFFQRFLRGLSGALNHFPAAAAGRAERFPQKCGGRAQIRGARTDHKAVSACIFRIRSTYGADPLRFLRKQIDKRAQFLEGTVLLENQRVSRFQNALLRTERIIVAPCGRFFCLEPADLALKPRDGSLQIVGICGQRGGNGFYLGEAMG